MEAIGKRFALLCFFVVVFSLFIASKSRERDLFTREESEKCEVPQYDVRILSYNPLMIRLENFITPNERDQLLNLAWVVSVFYQLLIC
jgi:hypothetical protein